MLNYRSAGDQEDCDLILTCGLLGGAPARTRSQTRAEGAGAGPKLPRSPSRRSRSTTSSDNDSAEETKAMEISDSDDSVTREVSQEPPVVTETKSLLDNGGDS